LSARVPVLAPAVEKPSVVERNAHRPRDVFDEAGERALVAPFEIGMVSPEFIVAPKMPSRFFRRLPLGDGVDDRLGHAASVRLGARQCLLRW
jgi:hypothetical protein